MAHSKNNFYVKKSKNGLSYSIKEAGFYEINEIHGTDSIKIKFSEEELRLFAIFTQDSQIILNHLYIDGYDSIENVIDSTKKVSYSIDAKSEVIFEFKSLKNRDFDDDEEIEKDDTNKIEAKFWLLPRETCGKSSIFEFGGTGSNLTVGTSEKLITTHNSNEKKYRNCIFSPLFDTKNLYSVSFDIQSELNNGFSKSKIELYTNNFKQPDWTMKNIDEEKTYSTAKPFFVKYEIVQRSNEGQFISPFKVETRMIRQILSKKKVFVINSVSLGCFYGVFDYCDSIGCFHDTEFEAIVTVKCDNERMKKVMKIVAIVVGVVLFVIIVSSIVGCCFCCGAFDACCCCPFDCCCCCPFDCCCCCPVDCCCCCCNCNRGQKQKNKNDQQQANQNIGSSNSIPQLLNKNKSGQQNDIELPLMDINQQQQEHVNTEIIANPYGLQYESPNVEQQQQQITPEPISPYSQENVQYL